MAWCPRLALMVALAGAGAFGCGDDDSDASSAGAAGDGADPAGDGPDSPDGDDPQAFDGPAGATETNVLGAPCESDAECPMSFCADPAPDGSRVCAAPGLVLVSDEDAGV